MSLISLMCKTFGHKMRFNPTTDVRPHCVRCGHQDYAMDEIVKSFVKKWEAEDD